MQSSPGNGCDLVIETKLSDGVLDNTYYCLHAEHNAHHT